MSKKWYCCRVYNNKDHKRKTISVSFYQTAFAVLHGNEKERWYVCNLYIDLLLLGMKDHNFIKKIFINLTSVGVILLSHHGNQIFFHCIWNVLQIFLITLLLNLLILKQ